MNKCPEMNPAVVSRRCNHNSIRHVYILSGTECYRDGELFGEIVLTRGDEVVVEIRSENKYLNGQRMTLKVNIDISKKRSFASRIINKIKSWIRFMRRHYAEK